MSEEKQDSFYKWTALMVVVIGTFMSVLDSSIVNIAIPKMMAVFGVNVDQAKWIITAYSLTLGAVIPLTGYLSDKFGTKRLYIFSLVMFTIGSLFCGLAWNNNIMIISRIIQGLGGGMIMPVSMSIIYEIIPKEERGTALGFWGIAAMAAPAIGPTLGGHIIEYLNWRLIFTINIPIGIIAVFLAWILLKPSEKKPVKSFDYIGFITCTSGLVSCLYVLGEGSTIDWSDLKNLLLMIFGCFNLLLFVINELTIEEPLLDLKILKIFPFALSILISSILNMALFGVVFIIPLYLQNLRGYTAIQTGMLMFPSAIATGLTMPIGGKLFDKIGAKKLVIPGVILLAWTTYELSKLNLQTSPNTINMLLILRGVALGLTMMPSMTSGMNAVPQQLVSKASALSNMIRQVAAALSVTILSSMMQYQQNVSYARLCEQITYSSEQATNFLQLMQGMMMQNGLVKDEASSVAKSMLSGLVQQQAFLEGISYTLVISTLMAVVIVFLAMLIKDKQKTDPNDKDII